jgi:hypothetical protein
MLTLGRARRHFGMRPCAGPGLLPLARSGPLRIESQLRSEPPGEACGPLLALLTGRAGFLPPLVPCVGSRLPDTRQGGRGRFLHQGAASCWVVRSAPRPWA